MTVVDNLSYPAGHALIDGDGNVTVDGDVDGDIVVNLDKRQDLVQLFGDGSGYRDLIVRDEIDPSHLVWLRERFVEPGEFTQLVNSLREHKILFMHGRPRSGRWTTGVCALAKASGTGNPTINIIDFDEGTQLALRRVATQAHVLLDLTTAGAEVLAKVEEQLRLFLGTIATAKAQLVVLLPEPPPPGLQALYQNRLEPVTAPAATDVLRAHLVAAEIPAEALLAESAISTVLARAHPADAARMAKLVTREYRTAGEGAPVSAVVGKAVLAYGNWSAELISTYDKVDDPRRRSLLLTVALLNGGTTEIQYWAERVLLSTAGYSVSAGKPLEGRGFAGRLAELDGVSIADDRAWFDRLDYDRSVLRHVWRGYPELRGRLVDWVIALGLGQQTRLDSGTVSGMVDRFFDLCASQDVVKYVSQVAKRWAESGKATPTRLAVHLLTAGALDDRSAAVVHRQLNTWAGTAELGPALVDLVLAVCRSDFGRRYTDKALTRLGNLAGHTDRAVSDKVVTAVVALVRDNRAFAQVLTKLHEWLRSAKDRQRAFAVRILRELLAADAGMPEPELDQPVHRPALVRVWRALLVLDDLALVQDAVVAWLELATTPDRRDPLLDVLVDAASTAPGAQIDRIGAVSRAADGWLGFVPRYWRDTDETDSRAEVHHALAQKMLRRHPFAVEAPGSEGA